MIKFFSLLFLLSLTSSYAAPAPKRIGFSQCNLGEPWRVQMNSDIKQAAALFSDQLTVIYKDAQNDSLKQRAQIEEFINAKVDAIIVSPKEAAPLTEPIKKAYEKNIPVIVLDRNVLGNSYTTFIGADNKKIGAMAAEWIVQELKRRGIAQGNIVELQGLMTSTPGQERHQGFIEVIKKSPHQIVFSADMKWLEPEARKEMESALARTKKIDVVYAHNDPAAHGAYLAALAAGRAQNILFVGIDGLKHEGQTYVQQKILAASFEYPTGGKEAIDSVIAILNHHSVAKKITLSAKTFTR